MAVKQSGVIRTIEPGCFNAIDPFEALHKKLEPVIFRADRIDPRKRFIVSVQSSMSVR